MQDIGDAILRFVGDTTDLDQVFAKIPGQADAAMSAAAASTDKVGVALEKVNFELDATAQNVPYAGETIKSVMEASAGWTKSMGQELVDAGKAGTSLADAVKLIPAPAQQSDSSLQNMAFALRGIDPAPINKVTVNLREAKGEARLLGEAFGIHLPRHVSSFLAELPGVGAALSAAFSATAVLFLVEALIQGADKLSNFIADTFIYTEAMKAADAATAKANMELVKIAEATKKANDQLSEYGMTTAQKTSVAIEAMSKNFASNAVAIAQNQVQTAKLQAEQQGLGAQMNELSGGLINTIIHYSTLTLGVEENTFKFADNREEIRKNQDALAILQQKQKEMATELALLSLQLRDQEDAALKERLQKQQAYNQAVIAGSQLVASATLTLEKAHADAVAAVDDQSGVKRLQIGLAYENASYQLEVTGRQRKHAAAVQFENEMYQLEVANLQNRIAVEKTLGPVGVLAAQATQVQIEQLTKSHHLKLQTEDATFAAETEAREKQRAAKTVQSYADMVARVQAIVKHANDALIASDVKLIDTLSDVQKAALKTATEVEKAFQALGVTPVTQLEAALKVATQAYNTLSKTGVASAHDLQKAYLSVLQTQLEYDKAIGNTAGVKADQKAIEDTIKTLQKFEGETKKTQSFWDAFSADFKKKAHDDGTAAQQMGKMIGDSLKQMQQGFESSIAAAELSEESFVAGLEKATAATLAQLSAQAAVKAIYFTAMGLAELATGFSDSSAAEWFAAAAEMGLVAGAAGAAGHALAGAGGGGKNSGSSGSGSSNATITQNASTQTSPNPTASVNVPHLYSGAIVTKPTLAMVGDSEGGGSQVEGVFPLGSSRAHDELAKLFGGSGGGVTTINHYHLPGFTYTTADVTTLSKRLTRAASTGRARLSASNSSKVTRKA